MNPEDWFGPRIPSRWGCRSIEVVSDQDEILVVVDLGATVSDGEVARLRDGTREERMALAGAAETAFGRKVSWGVRRDQEIVLFTSASVPVMTRLRLSERRVLDTIIDAGLARTRSEALAWCVRLVGDNEKEWLGDIRRAFEAVEKVRAQGPKSRRR